MTDVPQPDEQDQAEVLDETHLTEDGEDIANFDEIPDVLDVTSAVGDGEDGENDEEWAADWSRGDGADAEESDDGPPLTRLEDRPDAESEVGALSDGADRIRDDPDQRPTGLGGGARPCR